MGHFNFILGAAGCGKSSHIYKELTKLAVENPEKQYYLFVPEQNTLKAQQELIRHSEVHGMLNLDVLSFNLLSFRVMEELGITAPQMLDEMGKSLLMRKALSDVKDELSVYKRKTESSGFVVQLKSMLTEFAQYGVSHAALLEAHEKADTPLLKGKLHDVDLVFERFTKILKADGNRVIPEEIPALLLKNLNESKLLDESVICFDGFTGFTPVQLDIIGRIAEKAESLSFAVTLPKEEALRRAMHFTDLFWLSHETVRKVSETCEKAGLIKGQDMLPDSEAPGSGKYRIRESVTVRSLSLDTETDETRYIASDILKKTRGGGYRYRRMAIAASDLPQYKETIKREFSAAGIPLFIDDRASALDSPVTELIRSGLGSIDEGYSYEDVITYLKNPLKTGREDRDILDITDNYIRALGLKGKKTYQGDWAERKYVPTGMGQYVLSIEEYRKKSLESLFRLHENLKNRKTAGQKAEAVKEFIKDEKLSEKITSDNDARFLSLTLELLDRIDILFGEMQMSMKEFRSMMEAGFSDMKAGVIPGTMDMVSAGDLKRSRFDDIDVLYIVGANEGLIPQVAVGGGLFTDRERMQLASGNLELAPDDRHDASIQEFYLYLCMNKPVKELTITCSKTDRKGKTVKPSVILKEFRTTDVTDFDIPYENTTLTDTGEHGNEKLSKETATMLYGNVLTGSVTRLEGFERCPFSQFANHGLRLRERETFDVEAVDIGRMYHEVLDRVLRELKDRKSDLGKATDEELEQMTGEAVSLVTGEYGGNVMEQSARNRYVATAVRRISLKSIQKLADHYRNGEFVTVDTEHGFTTESDGLKLTGKIDRIDILSDDEREYVKIIDYKSGTDTFEIEKCLMGLQMQLPAYMSEVLTELKRSGKDAVPAGMFLYNLNDPFIKVSEQDKAGKNFRMSGVCINDVSILEKMDKNLKEGDVSSEIIPVNIKKGTPDRYSDVLSEEGFEELLRRNRERMKSDTEKILDGHVEAEPYIQGTKTACDYCRYRAVCGFDRTIKGFSYRRLEKISAKEALGSIEGNDVSI
ncbi:MAG: PD-(D/E)XK nuclease family protein [Lachnospiraceae bacterium]|nr:PD-(D/E)XK nuclease family protein [Lachnospiraceae bacterium]